MKARASSTVRCWWTHGSQGARWARDSSIASNSGTPSCGAERPHHDPVAGQLVRQVEQNGCVGHAPRPPAAMLTITEQPGTAATLRQHAAVPIAFTVASVFDVAVADHGPGGWRGPQASPGAPGVPWRLTERRVAPYVKDDDALEPPAFADRWDTRAWGLLAAFRDQRRVGGAVVAMRTPGLDLLAGREDLAALVDIRVEPLLRGRGVGSQLFSAACAWARAQQCRQLMIETQNTNVPACRFYARQGCELRAVRRHAYPALPHEVQLLWSIDL
jgi:GNAT superfamily N-acetyltransferase